MFFIKARSFDKIAVVVLTVMMKDDTIQSLQRNDNNSVINNGLNLCMNTTGAIRGCDNNSSKITFSTINKILAIF